MLTDFVRSISGAIARTFRDRTGATAAVVAIALPGLIGMGAVGAETGVWLALKLQNQAAADSAAIAAAYEVIAGKTDVAGELTAAADGAARRNGYKGSAPLVVYPYSDGTVTSGIAVTLEQRQDAGDTGDVLGHLERRGHHRAQDALRPALPLDTLRHRLQDRPRVLVEGDHARVQLVAGSFS